MSTDVKHQVQNAAKALGLELVAQGDDARDELVLIAGRRRVPVEMHHRAVIDVPRARATPPVDRPVRRVQLWVADRIVQGARAELTNAGHSWLDLRGHLRLDAPGVLVDAPVPGLGDPGRRSPNRGGANVMQALAVVLLLRPEMPLVVRAVARTLGVAPSSVSRAARALRLEGLLDGSGNTDPEALFAWLSRGWKPFWYDLFSPPDLLLDQRAPALDLTLDDLTAPGWALTGSVAASDLGAPISIRSDTPLDFYLPSSRALRVARTTLGDAGNGPVRTRVALAPVLSACVERLDVSEVTNQRWPVTRTLFVALDLAQDPGRGTEILQGWDPQAWGTRVW